MPKPKSAAELREKNREFADAAAPCDLVLKGGAASGFVYSGTIVELAKTYRLQSIGGTSAGAGAAGVAAAAEYGRRSREPASVGVRGNRACRRLGRREDRRRLDAAQAPVRPRSGDRAALQVVSRRRFRSANAAG